MTTGSSPIVVRLRSALFEIAAGEPPERSRTTLWVICALFAALLVWAFLAKLDIVAVAEGRLVPQTYVKIVQPAEAGIVREILVREGTSVRQGDVLVRLDPTLASADRRSVGTQLALKRLMIRRIEAQLAGQPLRAQSDDDPALLEQVRLDGQARERAFLAETAQAEATEEQAERELAAARATLQKLQRTQASYEKSAEAYRKLAEQRLIGALTADEKQREAIEHAQDLQAQLQYAASLESTLRARRNRVVQLKSAYQSALQSERSQLLGEINQLQEEAHKQGFREQLLELRAPQDGIVKDLATTTLGAVVQPGTVMLTLVPKEEPLLAEVYIQNQDVGFVREGQKVRIKIAAYTFTKYGMLDGTVRTVSADASQQGPLPEGSEDSPRASFKAVIALPTQFLERDTLRLPLVAGMQVQAEIREGERPVLEYLLSPIQRIADEGGRER
jgi:hemolysin D